MSNERVKIQNSLRLYRRKRGLSQKDIARLLGYQSTTAISSYERGTKAPQLTNLLRLEIIYRIPVAFLFWDHYRELRNEIHRKEEKILDRKQRDSGV
jgi:transcriptional regulator with XRE-family HTH domain